MVNVKELIKFKDKIFFEKLPNRLKNSKSDSETAWILLAYDLIGDIVPRDSLIELGHKIISGEIGKYEKDLRIIAIVLHLFKRERIPITESGKIINNQIVEKEIVFNYEFAELKDKVIEKSRALLKELLKEAIIIREKNPEFKFNILNDPYTYFILFIDKFAFYSSPFIHISEIPETYKIKLFHIARDNISGSVFRKFMFFTALKKMDFAGLDYSIENEIKNYVLEVSKDLQNREIEDIIHSFVISEEYRIPNLEFQEVSAKILDFIYHNESIIDKLLSNDLAIFCNTFSKALQIPNLYLHNFEWKL